MRTNLSRDEIVERGLHTMKQARKRHAPWIYYAKVKSGRNATKNITGEYYNIRHLMADMIIRHAKGEETLNIYAITRVMRANLCSIAEDI